MEAPGRVASLWWVAVPAAGLLAGAALQMQQSELWPALWVRGLAAAGCLCVVCAALLRRRAVAPALCSAALAALALGFAVTSERAAGRLADGLDAGLEGEDIELTGLVAQMPRVATYGTRFVFDVESARHRAALVRVPQRVLLTWYDRDGDSARGSGGGGGSPDSAGADTLPSGPAQTLGAGQRWQLVVRLRQPHGALNPHGFDLELWLFEQGIGAVGYVRAHASAPALRLGEAAGAPIERLRQAARDAIERRVADRTAAGVLAALALGDQGAIERDDWELFRLGGVAHLMSISGLHVTMLAWLAAGLIGALWRRSERLVLAVAAGVAGRWGGLAVATAYALFAGWGVPAQRTVWMLAVVVALRGAGVRWPLLLVLLVAAALVVALDPWALMQPGFWLSFVAVALLVAAAPERLRPAGRRRRLVAALRSGLRTQALATAGLTPLTLLFFQQVSVVGFVANLVAIPLVTLVITPLALAGLAWPALWMPAGWGVQALLTYLSALVRLPFAVWTAAAAPPWAVAAGLLGGALAVLPLPWRLRALALPLVLPLLLPVLPRPDRGRFEIVAVDVGQGTAVLVRTRDHLLVYDSGPQYSAEADAGSRVLVPLLRARGERAVDLLVLSHRDSDHVGGAASLLAAVPVRELASSLADDHPLRALAQARGARHTRCVDGTSWSWDGVRFEMLHPQRADYGSARKPNALSCVLRVEAAGRSALLAGDIEAAQEAALVARGADLRSELLLVPHHGSRTSSTPAFLDAVAPRLALVQAAYRSRFGHPAPDVMARYAARGIVVVRSDRCGAWTAGADGREVCAREDGRRYWHHRNVPGPDPATAR
ncbi:MAG TPA: DNA internalization-related competence protein ComEC/Rec2, partial [Rubrivivax sp.]|nr:DNA internalization-related competence protein ComEC/Rec2 [Rubrivivax sp.]